MLALTLHEHLNNPLLNNAPAHVLQGSPIYALTHFSTLGNYVACKWLISTFMITVRDMRSVHNEPLRRAAANGYLMICKLLSNEFALTRHDCIACDNEALRLAAANGHLNVCTWLASEFKLTYADAMTNDNEALSMAAENGHARVVLWLVCYFGMSNQDVSKVHPWFVRSLFYMIEEDAVLKRDVMNKDVAWCGDKGSWIVDQLNADY